MCNRKAKMKSAGHSDAAPARLELTCQPEQVTFRDEGGRFNYLFLFAVLRVSDGAGLPAELLDRERVALDAVLQYEDGTPVPDKAGKPGLRLFGDAGTDKPRDAGAAFNCKTWRASLRFKILKLSRNHDGKRFRVKLSLRGVPDTVVKPVCSRPTLVLSKRKKLKADDRVPESQQRKHVEELASKHNTRLSREAQSAEAIAKPAIHIRTITGLEPIESEYPVPIGINVDSCAAAATAVAYPVPAAPSDDDLDDDEDSDEDYQPPGKQQRQQQQNSQTQRKRKFAQDQNAALVQVAQSLASLQKQIEVYNETVSISEQRISALEAENVELKRKIETLELDGMAAMKKQKVAPSLLTFSRSHSLALVEGEDDQQSLLPAELCQPRLLFDAL
ncbi:Hypothetical protein SCF082_LOCUS21035 [Durusdinium trenchii]|uniref:Uncharacterized protein n=1 Tax=Durusdinium trenchii TaxID=1381693 RepID=A0ABP0L929_9DINO